MPGALGSLLARYIATGPSFADSLALKKIILMWSVLASSIKYSFRIDSQSPPLKYGWTFLQEKFFVGYKPFWANLWGLFYMG